MNAHDPLCAVATVYDAMGSRPAENPATVRARRSLATRQAAGGRVVRVILSPEAARALDSLAEAAGDTMTRTIERALVDRMDELRELRRREGVTPA